MAGSCNIDVQSYALCKADRCPKQCAISHMAKIYIRLDSIANITNISDHRT